MKLTLTPSTCLRLKCRTISLILSFNQVTPTWSSPGWWDYGNPIDPLTICHWNTRTL